MNDRIRYLLRCFERIFILLRKTDYKQKLVLYGEIYSTYTKYLIEFPITSFLSFSTGPGIRLDMADYHGWLH